MLSGGVVITSVTGSDYAWDSFVEPDDDIVVAGRVMPGPDYDFLVLRYKSDGALDPTFGDAGIVTTDISKWGDQAYAAAPYSDGKILLGGWANDDPGPHGGDFALARYNADGSLDQEFGGKGKLGGKIGFNNR